MNTLHTIFDWLIAASLRASALTLLVFVIQWVLQRHISPRWRYSLWLPVLIVLLAPVLPESRWSIESVFQAEPQPVKVHSVPVDADAVPVSLPPVSRPVVSAPAPVDWRQIQLMTWALGSSLLLLIGGVSFLRTLFRFRQSRESVGDDLLSQLDAIAREVGLRSSPQVLVAAAIQSPAVTGLLRPTLLLPAGFERDFTAEEARLILQHELTHLKRHDLPLNTLLCVLMALHWFNPLLWLAFFKARADREAACDAQVLENATPQRRSAYGHALLKIESAFAPLRLSLGFIGILQRHASLRARIRSIASPARTRPLTGMLVMLCMACMTFLGITRAAADAEKSPEIHLTARFIEINGVRNDPDSADKALAEVLAGLPASQKDAAPLRAVLDDPQHQLLIRRLSSMKGVDLMTTPNVITRSGQKGSIEVVREFALHPGSPQPEKKVGVMLDVLPTLTDADRLDLTLNPRIVEFEGFVKDANGMTEPVFIERKADARLSLKPGQTALLDLGSRTDTQDVEDIIDGKTTRYTDRFTRRAIVLVTARVVSAKKPDQTAAQSKQPAPLTMTDATKSVSGVNTLKLNFPDDRVETIISLYEKLKGKKVSVDPSAKGNRVKIVAPEPLPHQDAIAFIEAGLLLNGFALANDNPDNLTLRKSVAPQPSVIETKLRNIILPRVQFSGASIEEAVEYLRAKSRELDTLDKTGVQIIIRPGGTKPGLISLDLTNVPLIEALRYCTELAGLTYKIEPYAVTIGTSTAEAPAKLEMTAKSDAKTTVTTQANKIILPSVEFRDATLVEAIEFIRAKSRDFDPDKKGVNILLKGDGGTFKITLSLIDVPVPEALHYCAELSNYKLSADENSFVLTPAPPKKGATTSQLKHADDGAPGANTEAQEKAAELRRAKPQQYDFAKADLGDVIRFLATDAGIRFFSLPEDHPASQRLITFSLRSSPFEVLETICRANGVVLVLDQNVWYARAADDAALVRKSYALPKTPASAETILSDIRTLLNVPATNTGTSTQGAKKAGPEVTFKEAENSVHVVATRLQHMWVDGYFKGLGGNR